MKFSEYLGSLKGVELAPLSMETLLAPFRLSYSAAADPHLIMGWLLEDLSEQFQADDLIDPIDVASSALALGYIPADQFLTDAPLLLVQMGLAQESFAFHP